MNRPTLTKFWFSVAFALACAAASLPAATSGNFTYTDSGTSITITDYPTSATGAVAIPATIAGKPVTSIGESAFYGCSGLTGVTIPNSVTSIGDVAFAVCSGLTSVTIPNSVTSIGSSAFTGCRRLTNVTIPGSVTSIGESAFSVCSGLTSVTIPNSVTSIGNYAFSDCSGLTSVTIPGSVTNIGSGAFSGCEGLTSVTIPGSVTSIGVAAFRDCSGLSVMTIPGSVTSIGDEAFSGCSGLTSLTVDSANPNYSSAGGVLFNKLKTVLIQYPAGKAGTYAIPDSVTSIGDRAFMVCSGLTSVTIPGSVTSIGGLAFSRCSKLTSVTIPGSVTSIGNYAFASCSVLTSVEFSGDAPSLGSGVFSGAASGFVVQYHSGSTGFTSPTWNGYNSVQLPALPKRILSISGTLAFGNVGVNTTASATMVIGNTGDSPLTVTGITCPTGFSGNWSGGTIAAGGSQSVTVTFRPTAVQQYGGTIVVASNRTGGTNTTTASGAGVPVPGTSGNFTYMDYGSTITISGGVATPVGVLAIPSAINGKPVTSIVDDAFSGCSGLTSVTIPNSVTSIGARAFAGCSGLTGINVDSANPNYSSAGGVLFNKLKTVLIQYPAGKAGAFTIPATVTSIGDYAFSECSNLTSVTIPSSVTSTGNYAFSGCSGLARAEFLGDAPAMGTSVFSGTAGNFTVRYYTGTTGFSSPTWNGYPASNPAATGARLPGTYSSDGVTIYVNAQGDVSSVSVSGTDDHMTVSHSFGSGDDLSGDSWHDSTESSIGYNIRDCSFTADWDGDAFTGDYSWSYSQKIYSDYYSGGGGGEFRADGPSLGFSTNAPWLVSFTGGTKTLDVQSSGVTSWFVESDVSWIHPSVVSGRVSVVADANPTRSPRTGVVKLKSGSIMADTVEVRQPAAEVVAKPVISPASRTSPGPVSVSMSCATSEATIRYTTDGTAPTATSTVYAGEFVVGSSSTVRAQAFKTGYIPSALAGATYTINTTGLTTLTNKVSVAALSGAAGSERVFKIAVPAGQAKLVIVTSGGTGNANLYVKRGAVPTVTSYDFWPYLAGNAETVTVAGPVAGDWYIMVRGSAAYSGLSLVATYTPPVVATPVISPGSKTSPGPVSVTMSCATVGATIRYTTNGTAPTATSAVYAGAFVVGSSGAVKSQAFKTGYTGSPVASATYTISTAGLTTLANKVAVGALGGAAGNERVFKIVVPAGQGMLQIMTSGGTGDVTLYVKRGAVPTTTNYDYRSYLAGNAETVTVGSPAAGNWYIMVRGLAAYSAVSLVASYSPPVGVVATPVINPGSTTSPGPVSVTMSCATVGATIRYTTNGTAPTATSTVYAGPFVVGSSGTVKAQAFKTGYTGSPVASATYTINTTGLTALTSKVPVSALGGAVGSERVFKIAVPAGQGILQVKISGGTGDANLYVKRGAVPTVSSYDYRPYLVGNAESVTVLIPVAGDWYIMVRGAAAYTGLSLVATSTAIPAGFALIPAGSFQMGNALSASGDGSTDELPVHAVNLSQFYMEKKEVSKAQWDAVYTWAVAHGYGFDNAGSGKATNHPVQTVNWYDCVKWCNARSEKEGLVPCYTVSGATYKTGQSTPVLNRSASGYRLPTEAEWEKAARGGLSGKRFSWGDTISHSQANYWSGTTYSYDVSPTRGYHPTFNDNITPYTSPVGSFAANGYGLYDMAGNMWEWCWDWHGAYTSESATNPTGPASGTHRALRGGSWLSDAYYCRVAARYYAGPSYNGYGAVGFRCTRSAVP